MNSEKQQQKMNTTVQTYARQERNEESVLNKLLWETIHIQVCYSVSGNAKK